MRNPPLRLPRSVEFIAYQGDIVVRISGHLPKRLNNGRLWRGDIVDLATRGRTITDPSAAWRAKAAELMTRPGRFDLLQYWQLPDGRYAFGWGRSHPQVIGGEREVLRGADQTEWRQIFFAELPDEAQREVLPHEERASAFEREDHRSVLPPERLIDGDPTRADLIDTHGCELPGRPMKGVCIEVRWGAHPALFDLWRVEAVLKTRFDVSDGTQRLRFNSADWDRWLRARLAEGLVFAHVPGCDRAWCLKIPHNLCLGRRPVAAAGT